MHSWARIGRNLALLGLIFGLATIFGLHHADTSVRPWTLHASPKGMVIQDEVQALRHYREGQFDTLKGPGVGYGVSAHDLWLVLELPAGLRLAPRAYVTVAPALLDHVDLYQVLPGESRPRLRAASGYKVQPSLRPLALRQAAFDIDVDDRTASTWMIRVQSRLYAAALVSVQDMGGHQQGELIEGFLVGVLVLFGLMSLALALVVRYWSSDGYAFNLAWMVLTFVALMGLWHGYLRLWLDWRSPVAAQALDALVASATLWAFYSWAAGVLRLKRYTPWLTWAMKLVALMCLPACAVAMERGWSPMLGAALAAGVMMMVVLVGIGSQMTRRRIESPIYLVFALVAMALVIIKVLAERGGLPYTSGTAYGWLVAMVVACFALLLDLLTAAMDERQAVRADRDRLHAMLLHEKSQLELRVNDRAQALGSANEALRLTESSQRELLSLASHEFRTPAAMIKGTLDALECVSEPLPPVVALKLGALRTASSRLIFLANKLIAHDRWRELSVKPQLRSLWAREWLLEVIGDYDDDVPIRLKLPVDDAELRADAVLLRIALQTLIDNALVHSADGQSMVRVILELSQQQVDIQVIDSGPGIADDDKEQVFERFFSSGTDQSQGLGLSIAAAVARMHGGQVAVSDATPHGACFHLRLPHLGLRAQSEFEHAD
ncbi:MAG: sensor histidine kinase [Ideonella sp.]|nr:sensor histidine kinase [Ideonella sp.]